LDSAGHLLASSVGRDEQGPAIWRALTFHIGLFNLSVRFEAEERKVDV
jgi:hypothetical protein